MNTTLWALIGGAIFTVLVALGAFRAGEKVSELDCVAARNQELDKIIVQKDVIIKEVPKIVTHVVTVTVTTEKTYHDAIQIVPDLFDPSCVMPAWWGELFVNAALGNANDPRRASKTPGIYGCLETAKATLSDLSAGAQNSARLGGVQQWAQLIGDGSHGK